MTSKLQGGKLRRRQERGDHGKAWQALEINVCTEQPTVSVTVLRCLLSCDRSCDL